MDLAKIGEPAVLVYNSCMGRGRGQQAVIESKGSLRSRSTKERELDTALEKFGKISFERKGHLPESEAVYFTDALSGDKILYSDQVTGYLYYLRNWNGSEKINYIEKAWF